MEAVAQQPPVEKVYFDNHLPPDKAPPGYMRFRIPVGSSWVGPWGLIRPDGKVFWQPGLSWNPKAKRIFDVIDLPLGYGPHWDWEPMDEMATQAHKAMLEAKRNAEARHQREQRRLLPGFREGDMEKDLVAEERAKTAEANEKLAAVEGEVEKLRQQIAKLLATPEPTEEAAPARATPGKKAG